MASRKQLINEIANKVALRILQETQTNKFDNWKLPSEQQLKQEFRIEHELKGNEFWDSESEFLAAVDNARTVKISAADDLKIDNRSRTRSKSELIGLISGYRSYPKYRNEDTVEAIYRGFQENAPMDMPIVVEFPDGSRYVFSGNTRMDVAYQLGIEPLVLLVRSTQEYY